jgi:hypothetical protein
VAVPERVDIPGTPAHEVQTPEGPVIRAYHGSPHQFDAFSMEHIGTGEGAQAFGHGIYAAESPDVAKMYRDNVTAMQAGSISDNFRGGPDNRPGTVAEQLFSDISPGDINEGLKVLEPDSTPEMRQQWLAEGQKLLDEFRNKGSLYTVDIHADASHMLDWDKPLSEQSAHVREALESIGVDTSPKVLKEYGEDVHHKMMQDLGGPDKAATALRDAGIPGIKYLDGQSRAAGEGSRNYVLFDAGHIAIREINGKAVERAPDPPATLAEAEARVGKPQTTQQLADDLGVGDHAALTTRLLAEDAAKAKAAETGVPVVAPKKVVDDIPEMQDVDALRRAGVLTDADEHALTEADETVKRADTYSDAYNILSGCVINHGD